MSVSPRFRFRTSWRRVSVLSTLVMLCVLLPAAPAAAAPANDNFASATTMTQWYSTFQSTAGATVEASEPLPSCTSSAGATVWFKYTPSSSGTVVADTLGSDYDTVLAVYTGASLATLTQVACSDDLIVHR